MRPRCQFLSFVLAGVSLAGVLRGQETAKIARPLPPTPPDKVGYEPTEIAFQPVAPPKTRPAGAPDVDGVRAEFDHVLVGEPGDGRTWARGTDYKASFGVEGATFIPFLGSNAPRNCPVRFALASATVDGVPIELAVPAASRDGERVVIERGDVDEVYDLSLAGVEQTFVVERLPARGLLRLDVDVETDLQADAGEEGLQFVNELGGVRYGAITVLDAAGARWDTAARLVDGRIRIEIPADFVRSASLPLRIDPLIVAFQVTPSGGVDQYYADMAFDVSANQWCVVYEEAFSASDHDVYTVLVSVTGFTVVGSLASVDYTGDFWGRPCIANNNAANNFMVAAIVYPPPGTSSSVKVCMRDALSQNVGTQFEVSGSESGFKAYCDIGGDPDTTAPTYYCVVWNRIFSPTDSDIHARLVTTTGAPVGSAVTYIDNSSATIDSVPRVSNSDGPPPHTDQEWNIVWMRAVSGGSSDIYAAQVHWDGVVTSPTFPVDVSFNNDIYPTASAPLDRASGPRPWMAVYQRATFGDSDVAARVFLNSTQLAVSNLTYNEGVSILQDQVDPDVDTDGSQFFVTYRQNTALNPTAYNVYASAFAYTDNSIYLSESHLMLGSTFLETLAPRVAAAHSSGAVSNKFGASWSRDSGSAYEVHVALFEPPYDLPLDTYCSGDGSTFTCPCGNNGFRGNGCAHSASPGGAALVGAGTRHVSNDLFAMTASPVPPSAPGLLFQGTAQTSLPFGDGELCLGGTIVRLSIKFATSTVLTFPTGTDLPISAQGLLPAVGGSRNYQVWFRDAAAFCTPDVFNLTNALHVVWLP